jgi:taurine dioxygenase
MSAVLESLPTQLSGPLDITPLAARIGAEVRGLRLSGALDAETVAQLRAALLRHRVLFFKGQQHLDDASHQAFGRLWGEIEAHPTVPAPDGTRFLELDSRHGGRADSWHTDVTFKAAPPKACILRAVVLPPHGGDTVWANTVSAYAGLPAPLKALADELWAVHGNDYDYADPRQQATASAEELAGRAAYRATFRRTVIEAEHPVVHVHPETGERALLLGHFAKRLNLLRQQESSALLELLHQRIVALENTVRWRWSEGDVAIWDNRATQHYAINDYGDQHRVVRRVTVTGEHTTAIDGRKSIDRTAANA